MSGVPRWAIPIVFGILGPIIGSTILYLVILEFAVTHHWDTHLDFVGGLFVYLLFVAFGTAMTFLPAAIAGGFAALLARLQGRAWIIYFLGSTAAGGLVAWCCSTMFASSIHPSVGTPSTTPDLAFVPIIGAISSAICAVVVRWPFRRVKTEAAAAAPPTPPSSL